MRILRKLLLGVVLLAGFVYGCDYLYFRFQANPYGEVKVERILAVHEKFNKIDYERTDPTTERCVNSMFPHGGHKPCWYLAQHTAEIVDVG